MSLDALINLQAKYNDQGRQGIQQLAKNIGGILQQKGIQDFERNAMDILRDGATPEKMEQISSMYPNMPKQEIWKYASEVGKRVDAQKLKDVFKNFQGWSQSLKQAGKSPTAKDVQAWMESQNLSQAQQGVVMQNFSKMVEFAKVGQPKREWIKPGEKGAYEVVGGDPTGRSIGGGTPDSKTALYQNKIKDLQTQYPELSSKDATGIILGTIKVMADEVSGTRYLVNTVTGTEKPLIDAKGKTAQPVTEKPLKKETIWDLTPLATGVVSATRAAGSVVTGTVGLPIAKKTTYARQFVSGAQNDLIRALSINPRFPVGEINRLKEEINLSPKIMDSPPQMKERARAIDNYLRTRVDNEMKAANDKTLSVANRQAARGAAKDINNFLQILGVPTTVYSKEDYNKLPAGTLYIAPDGSERRKGGK